MSNVKVLPWLHPEHPETKEDTGCLLAAEKQAAVRGAGALLAVGVAVLLAADPASAFFLCLAALALVDAAIGGARDTGASESEAHVWWLAPLYLVFLYVLTPWGGFPVGGLDAFAFVGRV
jgi:hypothetical protein